MTLDRGGLASSRGGDCGRPQGRFTAHDLKDDVEHDNVCPGPPNPSIYHKSLLYFVARALEPSPFEFEKPLVGLSKFVPESYRMPDGSKRRLLDIIGGPSNLVIAPTEAPSNPPPRFALESQALRRLR